MIAIASLTAVSNSNHRLKRLNRCVDQTRGGSAYSRMKAILSILVMVSCVYPAIAQDQTAPDLSRLSIEDLMNVKVETVYGASKFLEQTSDAPASVTVVTADDIQKYGFRTLAEVLASVRGFYIIYDRNYTYVGVRGSSRPGDYNARILFLINGHRDNDNIYDGAYVGSEFPVDINLIDHVEIIRGPGSAVYGTGAFAAVINVVTRRGRDLNGWEISAEAGSWNTYKAQISYGRRFSDQIETLLSGTFYHSIGHEQLFFQEFDSPATNNGIAMDADGDQSYSLLGDFIRGDFTIHALANSRAKHIPTASFGTVFNDSRTQTTDARRFVDFQYAHSFQDGWNVLARASYDWYGYHGMYIYDYAGTGIPPSTRNIDLANGSWSDFELDASRIFQHRHHLVFGAEYRNDFAQHQENYDQQPHFVYLDTDESLKNAAYYFQDNFSLRSNLILVGALRSDWYRQFGNTFSPRAGLIYMPTSSTRLKLIFNRAFRAPNRYEEFYANRNSDEANLPLFPERITSYELEIDQSLHKNLHFTAAAFGNDMENLITADSYSSGNNLEFTNAGYQNNYGLEFEFSGHLRSMQAETSYTFQNSEGPAFVVNSPHNLAKANISVPLRREKFFASFDGQYTSRMSSTLGPVLGGFGLVNATLLARHLARNLDLSASVENLFDKRYANSGGLELAELAIPQDGRSVLAKLTYRFSSR